MAPEAVEALRAVATVQSGRPGVAPEAAPAEVLAVLGADRAEDVPEGFVSALSGVNFRVELVREGGVRVLGVVHVAAEAGMGRVLEG